MADTNEHRTLRSFIQRTRWRLALLLVVGIALILLGIWSWYWTPTSRSYRVRISGGIATMNRHKVAEYLKRHGQEWNLDFEIQPASGTVEAIKMLESGKLDLALVNGLLRFPNAKGIRQVATLTSESMHLLVKSQFSEQITEDYSNLAGISFNLGPDGSETALMSGALLEFLRLRPDADVTVNRYELDELIKKLEELEAAGPEHAEELRMSLPDAIAVNSTIPSKFVEDLVETADFDLVPIHFARAFAQIPVDEEDLDRDHVDQIRTVSTEIPAYS